MMWELHRAIHCGAAYINLAYKGVSNKPNNTEQRAARSRRMAGTEE